MTKLGTIRFYESVDWDRLEKATDPKVKKYLKNVHEYLINNIRGNVLVLEVGCGTGEFIKEIANQVDKIIGIDVSEKLIEKARNTLKEVKNIKLIAADIDDVKIPKNFFDFVISMWTLPNIDNPVSFIKKMKVALKPGGCIFIDTYSEKATSIRIKMYKKYGLTVVRHDKKNIFIKEDLTEKIYAEKDLKKLFETAGIDVEIIKIHKLGYLCKATKSIQK